MLPQSLRTESVVRLLSLVLLVGCAAAPPGPSRLAGRPEGPPSQAAPAAPALEVGRPLERPIAPGESHGYELVLAAGQYLQATLRSDDAEISAVLAGPDGTTLAEAGATLRDGERVLAGVTTAPGAYRLTAALPAGSTASSYRIAIDELRPARPEDGPRVAARRELAAALVEGDGELAARRLEEVLPLARQAGDADLEVSALNRLGDLAYNKGMHTEVLAWAEQALAAAGDRAPWGEAYALNNMAVALSKLERPQESVARYREALDRWAALGDPVQQGLTFNNLGQFLLNGLGDLEGAAQAYEQAGAIAERIGAVALEAKAINGLALVARGRGELDQALAGFAHALGLARQERDQIFEATILRNMASLHRSRGEFEEALRLLFLVLENPDATRHTRSRTYHSLATLYMDMGDLDQAQASYGQVRHLWPPEHENAIEALINLGLVLKRKGNDVAALECWETALAISQRSRYQAGEALARLYRGELSLDQGEPGRALADLVPARDIFHQRKDRSQEAKALHQLGTAYQSLNDPQAASTALEHAMNLAEGDPALTALCLYKQAALDRDQGRLAEAQIRIENALKAVESLRRNIGSSDLRDVFFASKRPYYETSIDLLVRLDRLHPGEGYAGRALAASEQARSRGLLDLLAEGRVGVDRGLDPALKQREAKVAAELVRAQMVLQAAQTAKSLDPPRIAALRSSLLQVEQRRDVLASEIRQQNPRYAEVRYPAPLAARAVQELVDPDSALLEYAVGEEASYLFVVTREALSVYPVPPAGELETRVRSLRELLQERGRGQLGRYIVKASELYQLLVAPAEDVLKRKKRLL
ncbi:MAG TPA: tetratricopeptide repeat protein, partial [Thermoanaerobaculia bacterium]|nr:tetratricopeptide repeat protein [Thermoanaerobaculia bacterium]